MKKSCPAFTLVELLVTVSIVGTVFTLGLAKYNEFNRRQLVAQTAQGLVSNLRLAQGKALGGEKDCSGEFVGYRAAIYGDRYCLRPECRAGLGSCRWYEFPSQLEVYALPGFNGFLFKTLLGGTRETESVFLSGQGVLKEIVVAQTGNIYIREVDSLPAGVEPLPLFGEEPTPTPTSSIPFPTSTPTRTPSPTPTLTPTPIPTQIVIYAQGTSLGGIYPRMELIIDDLTMTAWDVSGSLQTYTYNHPTSVTHSQVKVAFTNDAYNPPEDRNLMVDRIEINSITYQTEDPSVYSEGSWDSATGCDPGYKQSEWLACSGYFQY